MIALHHLTLLQLPHKEIGYMKRNQNILLEWLEPINCSQNSKSCIFFNRLTSVAIQLRRNQKRRPPQTNQTTWSKIDRIQLQLMWFQIVYPKLKTLDTEWVKMGAWFDSRKVLMNVCIKWIKYNFFLIVFV